MRIGVLFIHELVIGSSTWNLTTPMLRIGTRNSFLSLESIGNFLLVRQSTTSFLSKPSGVPSLKTIVLKWLPLEGTWYIWILFMYTWVKENLNYIISEVVLTQ